MAALPVSEAGSQPRWVRWSPRHEAPRRSRIRCRSHRRRWPMMRWRNVLRRRHNDRSRCHGLLPWRWYGTGGIGGGCWAYPPCTNCGGGTTYSPGNCATPADSPMGDLSTNAFCICSICCDIFTNSYLNCATSPRGDSGPADPASLAGDPSAGSVATLTNLSL